MGIPPRDLSRELFVEIGLDTVKRAKVDALTDAGLWVHRLVGVNLQSAIDAGSHSLIILCANPGRGKTTLCLQVLDSHLASGGMALRVDAERKSDCVSLDEAIERTLRTFEPTLAAEEGRSFRGLLEAGKPLLVLLEDLNRIDHPTRFLQRILSWSRIPSDLAQSGSPIGGRGSQQVVVLVPIWPTYRDEIATRLKESPWVTILELDSMEADEADAAVRLILERTGHPLGSARRKEMIERLERDPILIGLMGRLLATSPTFAGRN
jgi:hypothetical protein